VPCFSSLPRKTRHATGERPDKFNSNPILRRQYARAAAASAKSKFSWERAAAMVFNASPVSRSVRSQAATFAARIALAMESFCFGLAANWDRRSLSGRVFLWNREALSQQRAHCQEIFLRLKGNQASHAQGSVLDGGNNSAAWQLCNSDSNAGLVITHAYF
jgi:hypothetical protein